MPFSNYRRKSWPAEWKSIFDTSSEEEGPTKEEIAAEKAAKLNILLQWLADNSKDPKTLNEKCLVYFNYFLRSPAMYISNNRLASTTLKLARIVPTYEELLAIQMFFSPGASEDLIIHLGRKQKTMPKGGEYVNLILDEIPLTKKLFYDIRGDEVIGFHDIDGVKRDKAATHAFVIALSGSSYKYVQPLGYAFTAPSEDYTELSQWIDKTIICLREAGFLVCALVSKHTKTFKELVKFKGVTPEKPYFVAGRSRVFYIFDRDSLIVDIRNTLISTNLYINDTLISWSDIVDIQMKHKILSKKHVNPAPLQKHESKLASQVFEGNVASHIAFKYGDAEPPGTCEFIATMADVLELVTTRETRKMAFTGALSQIVILSDAVETLQEIKLPHDGQSDHIDMTCFTSMRITLNAIMRMHAWFGQGELKSILMKHYTVKPIEKLLSEICKMKKVPTPIQFKREFSKTVVKYLVENSFSYPYDEDMATCIVREQPELFLFKEQLPKRPRTSALAIGTTSYRDSSSPRDPFEPRIIWTYFWYECLHKHVECEVLIKYYQEGAKPPGNYYNALPNDFLPYTVQFEHIFSGAVSAAICQKNVGRTLLEVFKQEYKSDGQPCPCYPVEHLIKLYLRWRIYYTLKYRNEDLKQKRSVKR